MSNSIFKLPLVNDQYIAIDFQYISAIHVVKGHRSFKQNRINYLRNKLFHKTIKNPIKRFFHKIPCYTTFWYKPSISITLIDKNNPVVITLKSNYELIEYSNKLMDFWKQCKESKQ